MDCKTTNQPCHVAHFPRVPLCPDVSHTSPTLPPCLTRVQCGWEPLLEPWRVAFGAAVSPSLPPHLCGDAHPPPKPAAPQAAFDAPALDRVEELARAGRFGEAIHLLLQLTFAALRGAGADVAADRSLTSREIVAQSGLPAASRASLRALVDAVERSLFGRREPDERSYADCMAEYEALVSASGSTS